jgi:hypothetical protein
MTHSARALLFLLGGSLSLLVAAGACGERLADCVEVYAGTGATRRAGFTRTACEDYCKSVQGTIDCYWDGSIAALTIPSVNVETGRPAQKGGGG